MKTVFGNIKGKKSDYKICKKCGHVNWYENTECHNCSEKEFESMNLVWIDNEYKFWTEYNNYTDQEAEEMLYDI